MDLGFSFFFSFQEPFPNIFLSRALPAACCDSKLSLGPGVQSSELVLSISFIHFGTEFCLRFDFGPVNLVVNTKPGLLLDHSQLV